MSWTETYRLTLVPNTLIQITSELLAQEAIKNPTLRQCLSEIELPKLKVRYIQRYHIKSCDFNKFIESECSTARAVIPFKPKGPDNARIKLKIGRKKALYISTISDLGIDMLRLDFPEGEYELHDFCGGYIIKTSDFDPTAYDAVQVYTQKEGYAGLSGTHVRGAITNREHLRIYRRICDSLTPREGTGMLIFPFKRDVECHSERHLTPVLFYLTKKIKADELGKVTVFCPTNMTDCGDVELCWDVIHADKGKIGIAVHQRDYAKMLPGFPGICLLASDGHRAIGSYMITGHPMFGVSAYVFDNVHKCEFDPCRCKLYSERLRASRLPEKLTPF